MSLLSPLEPRSAPAGLAPLSLAAVALATGGMVAYPEETSPFSGGLGALALVPAFLLAYYRGWRGAGAWTGAAAGLLAAALGAAVLAGRRPAWSPALPGTVATYAGIALAVGILAEVLRRERERAIRLALTDDLTGLPNRRSARWFLDKEFAAAERGRPVAVVLLDLDQFKRYNDRHGHPAGDAALRAVGRALDRLTRRMNLSARLGGEEFVCILSSAGVEEALVFVDRVREALRTAEIPTGAVTTSAGIATYAPTMRSPDDLLAAADRALYHAKHQGGDCVCVAEAPPAFQAVR
jgi:diguanylate cyclase (GGDEF)-like protein